MKEFPDDELDKLFRKSAEELDSDFDPQDWNALKNRLDENDGRTPAAWLKKWWPAGMLALLMLAGLTTYFLRDKREETVDSVAATASVKSPSEDGPTDKEAVRSNEEQVIGNSDSPEVEKNTDLEKRNNAGLSNSEKKELEKSGSVKISGEKVLSKNSKAAGNVNRFETKTDAGENLATRTEESITNIEYRKTLPRRWSKTGGVYLAPNHSIGRRGDGASLSESVDSQNIANAVKSDVAKDRMEKLPPGISNPLSNENSGNVKNDFPGIQNKQGKEDDAVVNNELTRLNISASTLKSRSLVWKKLNPLPKVEVKEAEIPPVTAQVKEPGEKETSPKFAVRFGYSPDFSSIGLKNLTKPGTAVSLLIEYAVLPKLYIQSGVARSSKVYSAEGGDYEWPSSWNDQTVRPYSTDGTCKVIEIPLNLRYDISSGARSRWFAGAGASSYYMQNEKYDYNYKPHTYGIKWNNWEGSTGWYWLSHINASAGYEYRFSKKLSLLAEPYVRIPVKKVGFGKVDLFTTGVWFSIRYTPIFKK